MIQLISKQRLAESGKKALASAIVLAAMGAGLMMSAQPAHAADFTVNTTNDAEDGFCNAAHCSLREAIINAGANPGPDTIKFNIPGSGVKTIKPTSELPSVYDNNDAATTVDGYSQPGSVVNTSATGTNAQPLIELDGSLAGSSANGLPVGSSNVTVKGLVINRFAQSGVLIQPQAIAPATNVNLQGNFIGTDPSGAQDLGNGGAGVEDRGNGGTIGGSTLDKRNLISGNGGDGVLVSSANSTIQGNLIGLKKDGISALGNSGNGVSVADDGDFVGNHIKQNAISFNGGLGIDLGDDGATANDAGDADSGPNNLQNKPVIGRATTGSKGTTIKGNLNSTPNRNFTIEFFSNPAESNDEGKTFLGEQSVTTDASGKATFAFKPQAKVPRGQFVTATASSNVFLTFSNTSEFSAPKKVVRP